MCIRDRFKNNERVNIFGRWEQGFYFESAVGATNVGSIKYDFDKDLYTNEAVPKFPYYSDKTYLNSEKSGPLTRYSLQEDFETNSDGLSFQKACMTGRFEMGSTIVLIAEGDKDTKLTVYEG